MAKPPDSKKSKDPARPTRSKAAREPLAPIAPHLEKLLNPGIAAGTAGLGSGTGLTARSDYTSPQRVEVDRAERGRVRGPHANDDPPSPGASRQPLPAGERLKTENAPTGLQPPPSNSKERRADFSAAHTARKSTRDLAQGSPLPSPSRGGVGGGGPSSEAGPSRPTSTPLPNPPPSQVAPPRLAHAAAHPGPARAVGGAEPT